MRQEQEQVGTSPTSPRSSTRRSLRVTVPSICSSFSKSSMKSRPSISPRRYREPLGSTRLWHTIVLCCQTGRSSHYSPNQKPLVMPLKPYQATALSKFKSLYLQRNQSDYKTCKTVNRQPLHYEDNFLEGSINIP